MEPGAYLEHDGVTIPDPNDEAMVARGLATPPEEVLAND